MRQRAIVFGLFLVVCVVQWAVPASMIWKRERALRTGQRYLFRTMPIDPYDAFRGRYITLRVEQQSFRPEHAERFVRGMRAYAVLAVDAAGLAVIEDLRLTPPAAGDYLTVRVSYRHRGTVYLQMPFDRYYLQEFDAPRAERLYLEHSRRRHRTAQVAVRVRHGFAVVEDVLIDGRPLREWLAAAAE